MSKCVVAGHVRLLLHALLVASAVTFAWGAWVYFGGVTATVNDTMYPVSEPGSAIDTAAEAMRFGMVAAILVIVAVAINLGVLERRSPRRDNRWVVAAVWVGAGAVTVPAMIAFGSINVVRPDLVDATSSHGYLMMCLAAVLMVAAAIAATVGAVLGADLLNWRIGLTGSVGIVGHGALIALVSVAVMVAGPRVFLMDDEYVAGIPRDMAARDLRLDLEKAHVVQAGSELDDFWRVSAVGLVGERGGALVTVDPFTGEELWSVRRPGTPDGLWDLNVVGDGSVVLARWRNLAIEEVYAYAADTGEPLWHQTVAPSDPWSELTEDDQRLTVRDSRTGDVQSTIEKSAICDGTVASVELRRDTLYAACRPPGAGREKPNQRYTMVAVHRATGTVTWRNDFFDRSEFESTFLTSEGCPRVSIDLATGTTIASAPCRSGTWPNELAGFHALFEDDELERTGPFVVVNRRGEFGPRVDFGADAQVDGFVAATSDRVFAKVTGSGDLAWLVAIDVVTGATDVLVGPTSMPDGTEPRVRGPVLTRGQGLDPDPTVLVTRWGVAVGAGERPSSGESGRVRPQILIPAG